MSGYQRPKIAGYEIIGKRPLGSGGNAKVWRARRNAEATDVALKVLEIPRDFHSNSPRHRERFARFRQEVRFMREHKDAGGIMPLFDEGVPETLSPGLIAWYTMPIGTKLEKHLENANSLEEIITAIHAYAVTLAQVANENSQHRDIKPANLFVISERYVIGDFGLVKIPETDVTQVFWRPEGSEYYYAPEMLDQSDDIDRSRADVFSLAKVLWVLTTQYNKPFPGSHFYVIPSMRLSTYVVHPRVRSLDFLMERATAHVPAERLTMIELRDQLAAWLSNNDSGVNPMDIDAMVRRALEATEPERRAAAEQQRLAALGTQVYGDIRARTEELIAPLITNGMTFHSKTAHPSMNLAIPGILTTSPIVYEEATGLFYETPPGLDVILGFSCKVIVQADGTMHFGILCSVGHSKTGAHTVVETASGRAAIGTPLADHQIVAAFMKMKQTLPKALEQFANVISLVQAAHRGENFTVEHAYLVTLQSVAGSNVGHVRWCLLPLLDERMHIGSRGTRIELMRHHSPHLLTQDRDEIYEVVAIEQVHEHLLPIGDYEAYGIRIKHLETLGAMDAKKLLVREGSTPLSTLTSIILIS